MDFALPQSASVHQRAFTVLELLIVVLAIISLVGLLAPALAVLRTHARTVQTRMTIEVLTTALADYVDQSPLHCYPTGAAHNFIDYSPTRPSAVLTQLAAIGCPVSLDPIDQRVGSISRGCLLDAWHRPYAYYVDGPVLTSSGQIDTSRMDGVAQRPAPMPDWNPDGIEPWAYLWSLGVPQDSADDAAPSNARHWLYHRSQPSQATP